MSSTHCTPEIPVTEATLAKCPRSVFGSISPLTCLSNLSLPWDRAPSCSQAVRGPWTPCPGSSSGVTSLETAFVRLPAPNLLLLRTGQLPVSAPSASGTSCLMEQELAPGKTINFNASEHGSQTESRHPGMATRGLEIAWTKPLLHA